MIFYGGQGKNFLMFTGLYSALLDSMIVAFCISIMTAQEKFKPVPSPQGSIGGLSIPKFKYETL